MKVFFENNKEIPKLTLVECMVMLGEERHHADFLDGLKEKLYRFIIHTVDNMISRKMEKYTTFFIDENEYFDQMLISITLEEKNDYLNNKYTGGAFYNENPLENGKLHVPQFDMCIAVSHKGECVKSTIELIVDHEINHMYDDWQWQTTGHEPLTNNVEWNRGDGRFISVWLGQKENMLLRALAFCDYLSLWSETNAYVNQAFKEFEKIGLRRENMNKKLKTTISYRNYSKQYIDLKYFVNDVEDEELREMVSELHKTYGRLSIPKPSNGVDYKDKLIKWSDGIFRKFIKRYCGIASLYLDRSDKKINR